MSEEKTRTEALHSTDYLRQLIVENPDLPLLVFAGENAPATDSDCYWCTCCYAEAKLGEFLDCIQDDDDMRCYTDREAFAETIENELLFKYDDTFDGTEADWEVFVNRYIKEYEPYWTKCIILYVDNI